jgi:calcineurin-like phosphoesterase family protein
MTIFFTGCTHFGHASIITLAKRPFISVSEMDEVMIERWNAAVRPGDTVYHHGDFKWSRSEIKTTDLNGDIQFLQGNHDPVGLGVPYREVREGKTSLVMMHYPIEEWNGWWKGSIHTHCHTHQRSLVSAPRRFNVGADALDFTPISLDEIIAHPNAAR